MTTINAVNKTKNFLSCTVKMIHQLEKYKRRGSRRNKHYNKSSILNFSIEYLEVMIDNIFDFNNIIKKTNHKSYFLKSS